MDRIQQVVLIIPIITTTLNYPAAVGEARTLQPPHDGAFPGVDPNRMGLEISVGLLDAFDRLLSIADDDPLAALVSGCDWE
jgi:hypothetical protein